MHHGAEPVGGQGAWGDVVHHDGFTIVGTTRLPRFAFMCVYYFGASRTNDCTKN
jgi:hypothetical protein